MQDTCGVTNPTGVHRHLDDLVFDLRRLPWIAIVQQEGATSTALLSAPVPLLALTGLAMANNIRTVAVGTVQDLENHDATRSRWGCSAAATFIKNSTSTPMRHLPYRIGTRLILLSRRATAADSPYQFAMLVDRHGPLGRQHAPPQGGDDRLDHGR